MKKLIATFSKLTGKHIEAFPDASWEYVIESPETNAHGFAGGILRKGECGLWQARHYEHTEYGPLAATREEAIEKLLPELREFSKKWKEKCAKQDEERDARVNRVFEFNQEIEKANSLLTGMCVGVNYHEIEKPIEFVVKIPGLSEGQARAVVSTLLHYFRRIP